MLSMTRGPAESLSTCRRRARRIPSTVNRPLLFVPQFGPNRTAEAVTAAAHQFFQAPRPTICHPRRLHRFHNRHVVGDQMIAEIVPLIGGTPKLSGGGINRFADAVPQTGSVNFDELPLMPGQCWDRSSVIQLPARPLRQQCRAAERFNGITPGNCALPAAGCYE